MKKKTTENKASHYCDTPIVPARTFNHEVGPERAGLIRRHEKKWVNGTILHFCFFNSPASLKGKVAEQDTVRKAFKIWKDVGIGLEFKEVTSMADAEIRIGFLRGDGAWSYIGRDVLSISSTQRTMNFGWDISHDIDTAIHEIGHTLGFPHEHQNPNAGIVWDEEKVYADLAEPPNRWDRDTTFRNIIRKIDPRDVDGSNWDPNSIMHYPFKPGLILEPVKYRENPLTPAPGLSAQDKKSILGFYPSTKKKNTKKLNPFVSHRLHLKPGGQENFLITPDRTRSYTINTFGSSDTVMVLFEKIDNTWRYFTADDDSGYNTNARLNVRLYTGRQYALRIRLYYQHRAGDFGLMMW